MPQKIHFGEVSVFFGPDSVLRRFHSTMLRSPAINMINHNNDIFVQMKKGESMVKLVSLMVKYESKQPVIRGEGARE